MAKSYRYWMESDSSGRVVNSGWLKNSSNPDFMHRPRNGVPPFTGRNDRNPSVDPSLVEEIYKKSIA